MLIMRDSDALSKFDSYTKLKTNRVLNFDMISIIINIYCQALQYAAMQKRCALLSQRVLIMALIILESDALLDF